MLHPRPKITIDADQTVFFHQIVDSFPNGVFSSLKGGIKHRTLDGIHIHSKHIYK